MISLHCKYNFIPDSGVSPVRICPCEAEGSCNHFMAKSQIMHPSLERVLSLWHCPQSVNLRCLFIRAVIRNPVFQATAVVIKLWSLNIYCEYFKYFILNRLASARRDEGFILGHATEWQLVNSWSGRRFSGGKVRCGFKSVFQSKWWKKMGLCNMNECSVHWTV